VFTPTACTHLPFFAFILKTDNQFNHPCTLTSRHTSSTWTARPMWIYFRSLIPLHAHNYQGLRVLFMEMTSAFQEFNVILEIHKFTHITFMYGSKHKWLPKYILIFGLYQISRKRSSLWFNDFGGDITKISVHLLWKRSSPDYKYRVELCVFWNILEHVDEVKKHAGKNLYPLGSRARKSEAQLPEDNSFLHHSNLIRPNVSIDRFWIWEWRRISLYVRRVI
jgi:hypothetical protein